MDIIKSPSENSPQKKKYNYIKRPGQPSKFDSINKKQLKTLIIKGFTDKEISNFFEITEHTFCNWKIAHPDFFQSLKDWKLIADKEVEKALFDRAKGYRTTCKKAVVVSDGRDAGSHVEMIEEEVVFAPDPTSCIFWLKNRQPENWRDKHEFNGKMDFNFQFKDLVENVEQSERLRKTNSRLPQITG